MLRSTVQWTLLDVSSRGGLAILFIFFKIFFFFKYFIALFYTLMHVVAIFQVSEHFNAPS